MTTPTTQEANITRSTVTDTELIIYRAAARRGTLDETVIVPGWLPGAGWTDVTSLVALSAGVKYSAKLAGGYSGSFSVYGQNRSDWPDRAAVAIVGRHWDGTQYSPWVLEAWGYITGAGSQARASGGLVVGEVQFDYTGFWDKERTPALRFGRPNLITTATVTRATPPLPTPAAEAPLEYRSQADCGPGNLGDGYIDTVAVLDTLATPTRPTWGDTPDGHCVILRASGSFTRGIAPGGQPRWLELYAGHNLTSWGDFENPGAVLGFDDPNDWPGGRPTMPYNDDVKSMVIAEEDGNPGNHIMVITAKANAQPSQDGPQWNIPIGARPCRVSVRYKAGSTYSIGKRLHITGMGTQQVLILPEDWLEFSAAVQPQAIHETLVLRFQGGDNTFDERHGHDVVINLDDLRVSVGYSDAYFQGLTGHALNIAFDNGLPGGQYVTRMAWNVTDNIQEWTIEADDTIILCDDAAAFRAQYDPGSRTVYQLKNLYPAWYFGREGGVGVGKIKLCTTWSGSPAVFFDYNDIRLTTIQEVDFLYANLGNPWTQDQALSRLNPVGTGYLVAEDFPHIGPGAGAYGAGFWQHNLGDYVSPYLVATVEDDDEYVQVDRPDEFPTAGFAYLAGTHRFSYTGKRAATLTGCTDVVASVAGTLVTPEVDGALQTANLIDLVELRRREAPVPQILAGAVLYSNLADPANPSVPHPVSGGVWDNNADWERLNRWSWRTGDQYVITIPVDPPVQAHFVTTVIDEMQEWVDDTATPQPQRPKLNELIVRRFAPGAVLAGGFGSTQASTYGGIVGYLLTQYAGVAVERILVDVPLAPLHDYTLTPGTVASGVATAAKSGTLRVWGDRWNRIHFGAPPNTPQFDTSTVTWTWSLADLRADPRGSWAALGAVAQVWVSAREAGGYRLFQASYPSSARALGTLVEVRDAVVATEAEARALARFVDKEGNFRRSLTIDAGPCPWLEVGQRHVILLPDLDEGGNWEGINMVVDSFTVTYSVLEGGLIHCATSIALREVALT